MKKLHVRFAMVQGLIVTLMYIFAEDVTVSVG